MSEFGFDPTNVLNKFLNKFFMLLTLNARTTFDLTPWHKSYILVYSVMMLYSIALHKSIYTRDYKKGQQY